MNKKAKFGYLLCGGIIFLMSQAAAHEFWIEPHDFTLTPRENLIADIKVGQMLSGADQFFIPNEFESFELIQNGKKRPIQSRTGDLPAVDEHSLQDGLAILAYASTNRSLRYSDTEKFHKFLKNEGIEWVKEAHEKRGLPATGFLELYRRYGKSLVKVGNGEGSDKALGLPFELVVETNPYLHQNKAVGVQLLWQGKPFPGAQVSMFSKTEDGVKHSLHTTDQYGRMTIPQPDKAGMVMLNAVHMIEPDKTTAEKTGAVWVSLWASTSYGVTAQ